MSESRWGAGRTVPFGNTCAVAICNSPRNVMYHRFPRPKGTIRQIRKLGKISTSQLFNIGKEKVFIVI